MCGGSESLLKGLQKKTLRRFVAEITILYGFFCLLVGLFFSFLG